MHQTLGQFDGPARSLMWRGGAVHLRGGGKSKAPDTHAHFAIQLSVAIGGELQFGVSRHSLQRSAGGWLVDSDEPHWMQSPHPTVTVFWDPATPQGRRIATRFGDVPAVPLSPSECSKLRLRFHGCWKLGWRLPDLRKAAIDITSDLAPRAVVIPPVDPRVAAVLLELSRLSNTNTSAAVLAAGVGLSESRLAHLFRSAVGIPIRQYRLALRMQTAVAQISRGSSLTAAAHKAGFADSAHFCRVCRRMFGSAPSDLPQFEVDEQ